MKNLLLKISLLVLALFFLGNRAAAQCPCNIFVNMIQDPVDSCCFDLKICNAGGAGCAGLNFNTLTVITNPNPTFTSNVISAIPGNPNVTPTIVDPFTVTFTSSVPYNSITSGCMLGSDFFSVGSFCVNNAAQASSSFQISIGTNNTPPTTCIVADLEFNTEACPAPPCTADFSFTSDCLDVQFTNLSSGGNPPLSYSWDFDNDGTPDDNTQNPSHTYPAYGTYTACLTVTDGAGVLCGVVCYQVTVDDLVPPTIICPQDVTVYALGCSSGEQAFFQSPSFFDNCPGVTHSCDHMSGDFFPCGQTTVMCTAMDLAGNTDQCTFTVNVTGCDSCAEIVNYNVQCFDPANDTYFFTINVNNLTNQPFGTPVASSPTGPLFNTSWTPGSPTGTFDGYINCPPPSTSFQVDLTFSFNCASGQIVSCTLPVVFNKPCCDTVSIAPQSVCATDQTANVPLIGCSSLPGLQQVTWYLISPCPGGTPIVYQVSSNCSDLILLPDKLTSDVCVYAVVVYNDGACTITSNTAIITLCQPVGCTMANASQQYCDLGAPVPVLPLTITPTFTNCNYTVQWCDGNGTPIPGETGLTYNPGPLSHIVGSNNDCFTTYQFTAKVTNICGTQSCSASITIYNDNSPDGLLTLVHPTTPPPYCPGQDATLRYDPECVGPVPYKWDWCESTVSASGPWTFLSTAGTVNTLYNTNKIGVDTWFKVEKINGVCPPDQVVHFIDIMDVTTIQYFHAIPDDPCNPTGVQLDLGFMTDCPTGATVYWYKDGNLIHTSSHLPPTASYFHSDPNYPGNYYAIIEDNCCHGKTKTIVHTIEPACFAEVVGPCFRCNDEPVTLTGVIFNLPAGANCTYQWYEDVGGTWVLIPGANADMLTVNDSGCYLFEALCDGCLKQAVFCIKQCGDPFACSCPHLATDVSLGFSVNVVGVGLYEFQPVTTLSDCNEISWEWGDGSPVDLTTGSAAVTHSFPDNDPTNVCMNVTRTQEDGNTCTESFCMMLTADNVVQGNSKFQLFPNPSDGNFTLYANSAKLSNGKLQVLDSKGSVILTMDLKTPQGQYPISIVDQPPGVYFVKVFSNGQAVWGGKVAKQ